MHRAPRWILAAGLAGLAGIGLRHYLLQVHILGESMAPTLQDGQTVLARRLWRGHPLRVGDIAVFQLPSTRGEVPVVAVKRVAQIRRNHAEHDSRAVFVLGDNVATSIDSRRFGWIAEDQIVGVLLRRRTPLSRADS